MSRLLDTYPTRHNSRGAANYGVVEADAVGRRSSAPGKQRPGRSGFNHDHFSLCYLLRLEKISPVFGTALLAADEMIDYL